jgi:endonuclease/exonuclease/phosphatase family metal-dependent hydrolase
MILKVLQWNVWYKENPERIADEILKINPDVICAQELMTNNSGSVDTAKSIAGKIGYDYVYVEGDTWDNRGDKESQGNAIFTKLPILSKEIVYVTSKKHNPQNATVEGRVYFELGLKFNSKNITIGTTHLSYSDRFKETELRLKEYQNLKDVLIKKENNFIFCADLNSGADGKISKDINTYLKNSGPSLNVPTWTTKPFDYHGFTEDKLRWRLDYVFASADLKVVSSEVVDTKYSDHLPILVMYEIE